MNHPIRDMHMEMKQKHRETRKQYTSPQLLQVLELRSAGDVAQTFIVSSKAIGEEDYEVRQERRFGEDEEDLRLNVRHRNLWEEHW